MAEDLDPEKYTSPLGDCELMQFEPAGRDGMVQLAEQYAEVGQTITWEGHPSTATSDPDVADQRLVIITDSRNNQYFLAGDRLYDLSQSKREGKLVGVRLRPGLPMPDLEIGSPSLFTDGNDVTNVLIATERINSFDPANTNTLADATEGGRDPFVGFSMFIKKLKSAPPETGEPEDLRSLIPKTRGGIRSFDYAQDDDPHKPGAVWAASDQVAWERGEMDYPTYLQGRGGVRISPSVKLITHEEAERLNREHAGEPDWTPVESNEYQPRRGESWQHALGEYATIMADAIVRLPGFKWKHDRVERKREERARAYWLTKAPNRRPPQYRHL